jgi:LuxR family transcriptional regulator, maltose regulon positive regulatory protein
MSLAAVVLDRGRLEEGEEWLRRAEAVLADGAEPAAVIGMHHTQGLLAMATGRYADALAAFRNGERVAGELREQHFLEVIERLWALRAHVRLGDPEPARAALAEPGEGAAWRGLAGHVHLADDDPEGAADAVAPVLDGTAFAIAVNLEIESLLIDAIARTELGQRADAERSVERALGLAAPEGRVLIFLTVPGVREVLDRHPVHRTAHPGHLKALLDHLSGRGAPAQQPAEPLSERELAVLRFLPTNLSATAIGGELFLSVHTVKTHMRKLYAKLGVHTRAEAVERGRELGLLGPKR